MSRPISLLLADDHVAMRDALGSQLNNLTDIEVVASVDNADCAVAEALRLLPDVVLMDIDMPGLGCFEAARTIQTRCPATRIVFLSAFFNDCHIEQALAVQAVGYVTKSEPSKDVIEAVRAAARGRSYFSAEVQERIVVGPEGARLASQRRPRVSTLTDRELEVLRYIARGLSQKEIARIVHVSTKTIHTHASNLMKKLAIHDRVALARFAIREGLAEA